jgi:hypothetical protein
MLRIRKQFGIAWFILIIGIHVIGIPVFFFCLLLDKIFASRSANYQWKDLAGYTKNVSILLSYFLKCLRIDPSFIKLNNWVFQHTMLK